MKFNVFHECRGLLAPDGRLAKKNNYLKNVEKTWPAATLIPAIFY